MVAKLGTALILALCALLPIANAHPQHHLRPRGGHGSGGGSQNSDGGNGGSGRNSGSGDSGNSSSGSSGSRGSGGSGSGSGVSTSGSTSSTSSGTYATSYSSSGSSSDTAASDASSEASTSSTSTTASSSSSHWQPTVGTTWQILLASALAESDMDEDVEVYDIDLFQNSVDVISSLQSSGKKVMCYFSAGCYTSNAPDASNFTSSDFGSEVDGYPGEYWLNINSDSIRDIMVGRIETAVAKGCNGIDMDNVDIYQQSSGLSITQSDSVSYLTYLAEQSHNRGLSLGLKNAGDLVSSLVDVMDWGINESCIVWDQCETYAGFITADKPLFHIEYPEPSSTMSSGDFDSTITTKYCSTSNGATSFSSLLKNENLDSWVQFCT